MLEELKHLLGNYLAYSADTRLAIVLDFNQAWLPVRVAGFVLGLVLVWFLLRKEDRQPAIQRTMLFIVGASWIFVGATFHLDYMRQVDWSAAWSGWAFVVQGGLMLAAILVAVVPRDISWLFRFRLASGFGAVLGLPLLQFINGAAINQLEVFGTASGAVCLMTAAIIPGLARRWAWLLVVPWLWSVRVFTIAWPQDDWVDMLLLPWMTVAMVLAIAIKRQQVSGSKAVP